MELVAKSLEIALIHELVKYYYSKVATPTYMASEETQEGDSQSVDVYAPVKAALESHGYYLGSKIVTRLTLGKGCIWDQNSCVILVCKDLWTYLFGSNASRLQSNSQGTYLILCDQIPWVNNVSSGLPRGLQNAKEKRQATSNDYKMFYLYLISGIVRGALAALGMSVTVVPSIDENYAFRVCLQT